jgi:hypothetical protein
MKMKGLLLILIMMLIMAPVGYAAMATFEDVDMNVPPAQNYTGGGTYYNGSDGAGGFQSGDVYFTNSFIDYGGGFTSWDGWAYSNTTDTTTPGFTNQYSAITGGGVNGSASYGVAYTSSSSQLYFGISSGEYNQQIDGFFVTNTTYAWDSMTNGDSFAKQFGGPTGDDPDWFLLTVYGLDSGYARTGDSAEFYLADYRFADNSQDYIVADWTWFDLTGLGVVSGLEFELSSTDNGSFGMNTPAYFAMDNLEASPVPVPAAVWLLGSGLLGLIGIRRRVR